MLKDADAIATIAVRKIDVARRFYEETLGLEPAGGEGDMRAYRSGSSTLMVYESQFAGTNRATAATWLGPRAPAARPLARGQRAGIADRIAQGQGRQVRALRPSRHQTGGRHPRVG